MELISASEAKQIATKPKQSAWLEFAAEKILAKAHEGSMSCLIPTTNYGPDVHDIATLQGLGYSVMPCKQFHGYEVSWELG